MNQDLATRDELLTLIDFLLEEIEGLHEFWGYGVDTSILALAEHILEQG